MHLIFHILLYDINIVFTDYICLMIFKYAASESETYNTLFGEKMLFSGYFA